MLLETDELFFRRPTPRDWPLILEIANRSVAFVPGAGPQHEWLENRRRFAAEGGLQWHVVAEAPRPRGLLGYAAIEARPEAPEAFRVFVVAAPSDLGTVGARLYEHARAQLRELRAQRAWFTEYAADALLLDFARTRGFAERRRFAWRGVDLVVLEQELGGAT